ISTVWGPAVRETKTQSRRHGRIAGRAAPGYRLEREDRPAARMFAVHGTVDAQSSAYHYAAPSFVSRHDAEAAAEQLTPVANHNCSRSAARSSVRLKITVTPNPLYKRELGPPHSFTFFHPQGGAYFP